MRACVRHYGSPGLASTMCSQHAPSATISRVNRLMFVFDSPSLSLSRAATSAAFLLRELRFLATAAFIDRESPPPSSTREIVFRNWKLISRGRQIPGGCNARLILGPRTRVEASNCFVIAKEKLAGLALFGGCDGESREFVLVSGISHGSVVLRRL